MSGVGSADAILEEPLVAAYRKTQTPGVYVRHMKGCPAEHETGPRCRCTPSYRGKCWDTATKRSVWSPTYRDRAEVLTWIGANRVGGAAAAERAGAGPSFARLADDWLNGVQAGSIGKRRGRAGAGYSPTTLTGYCQSLEIVLKPEFGARPASQIGPDEWQLFTDRLSREGLSRSRIANHLAVARAVYGWASRPARRLVPRNPLVGVELPPQDEKPRMRVADADEAALLLDALDLRDRVPYALAFYAGLRRAEIHRLEWDDVELEGTRITVRKAKSEAGTGRRPPIAQQLRPILKRAWLAQSRPTEGPVCEISVMSGKIGERARGAWGWEQDDDGKWIKAHNAALEPITLHSCRHTYASFLMAAGYTLKEIMEYGGWADLQMVQRYVKRLPQRDETDPAERLNAYLMARRS